MSHFLKLRHRKKALENFKNSFLKNAALEFWSEAFFVSILTYSSNDIKVYNQNYPTLNLTRNSSKSLLRLNFRVIKLSSFGFAKMPNSPTSYHKISYPFKWKKKKSPFEKKPQPLSVRREKFRQVSKWKLNIKIVYLTPKLCVVIWNLKMKLSFEELIKIGKITSPRQRVSEL